MTIEKPGKGKKGGLGEQVENTLIRFIIIAYESTIGAVSSRIRAGIDHFLEDIENEAVKVVRPFVDDILSNPELPDWARNWLYKAAYPEKQLGFITVGMAVAAIGWSLISVITASLGQRAVQWVNIVMRPALPDLNTIAVMYHKGQVSENYFVDVAQRLGYRPEFIAPFLDFARNRISASEFIAYAYLVGLGEGMITQYLQGLGYGSQEIEALYTVNQLRPTPSDLVRFAVREVWRDEVANKWGYDADYPSQFGVEMERAGDSEGWAKSFWRAHWELPSLTMILEMLHRGVITDQEFDEYLRVADYPVGWRERIAKIVYSPYTRVDTRRMFRFGVLDEGGVYQTYKDIGYDDQHALSMTEFTILDALEEERELTKTDVLNSYRLARFDRATAKQSLLDLGYNSVVADILLSNQDQALEDQRINNLVKYTHSLFVGGGLTQSEVLQRFAEYNLTTSEIDRYLELWKIERAAKVALPSRTSLDSFLKDDIITVDDYKKGLAKISYKPEAIDWYTQSVLLDKQAQSEKEHDRAVDEQEKLLKREKVTDYQREKARLTVELREIESDIGEWQNAIQSRELQFTNDQELARQKLTVDVLDQDYEKQRRAIQYQIDHLTTKNREYMVVIDDLQTQIADMGLQLEQSIDESLKETGRLAIAELRYQQEVIQGIVIEGKAEIVLLENEIVELVDNTFPTIIQQDIAVLQEEIEKLQDKIASSQLVKAELNRLMFDADIEQLAVLKREYLDYNVLIAEDQQTIDHLQSVVQELRIENIQPELVQELNIRQDLISQIRVELSEADILLQDLDTAIADIRVSEIDPLKVKRTEDFKEAILSLRIEIEKNQDVISANNVLISEHRAQLRGVRAEYRQGLLDLQRVSSLSQVVTDFNRDLATLTMGLNASRSHKNEIRVALAKLKYQFID